MKNKIPHMLLIIIFAVFISIAGCGDSGDGNSSNSSKISHKFGIQEAHYSLWDAEPFYECGTVDQAKAMFDNIDELSVKNFRYTIFWSLVERNHDGVYDWSRHDQLITYLAAKNLDISIMLHPENSSYDVTEKPAIVSNSTYHTAWLNFIEALVNRYGDKVKRWEIGNEEDFNQSWKPAANPAAYSAFLISTSNKIRSIQSDAFIIMGGVTPFPTVAGSSYGSRKFLKECFDLHVLDYVNAVGIHPYRSKPEGPFDWEFYSPVPLNESSFEAEINYLKNLIAGYKSGIELWNTESGYFDGEYDVADPSDRKLYSQVKLLSRFMLVDYAAGLKGLTYFRLRVNNQFPPTQPMFQGLIEEDIKFKRPAFTAMKSICDIIGPDDVVYVKTINTTGKIGGADTPVRIEIYTKNSKNIIAYWLPEDIDDVQKSVRRINLNNTGALKLNYKVRDILKTSVEVVDYTISGIDGAVSFGNLPVTDYPFILIE